MKQIKAGIIGGAGYTGGELIRLLITHRQVNIEFIHSKSNAGNYVYEVHQDLIGETDLKFSDSLHDDIDVLFSDKSPSGPIVHSMDVTIFFSN